MFRKNLQNSQTLMPMTDVPLTAAQIRTRLFELIEARHGSVTRAVIGRVAKDASLEPSTLARYFGLYPGKRQTERPHETTIRSVLLSLGEDPHEFFQAYTERQLELWPAAVTSASGPAKDASDALVDLAEMLRDIPLSVRVRAFRAAANAAINSVAEMGEPVPEAAYELLRRLDALQREVRHLKLIAV